MNVDVLGSQTTRSTGIHVSGEAVHAVELVRKRRHVSLARCLSARLDEPLSLPDALADDRARAGLARVLRALGRSGLSGTRPCFGLSGPAAFVKQRLRVPGDEDAAHDHLLWEAEQFLEEDVDDYVVDTLVTARHGFVIAARRQILELYGVLCREARFGTPGFDMVPFALCNALEATGSGAGGLEVIGHEAAGNLRAVLLRDGDFEAEGCWPVDDAADGLQRLCTATWGPVRAGRAWRAGEADDLPAAAWEDIAESVADLDPFAAVHIGERVGTQLADDSTRARVFAVAAGLAFRGLAEA